jgi:hypothetical protein
LSRRPACRRRSPGIHRSGDDGGRPPYRRDLLAPATGKLCTSTRSPVVITRQHPDPWCSGSRPNTHYFRPGYGGHKWK